jgi:hypothetical protein
VEPNKILEQLDELQNKLTVIQKQVETQIQNQKEISTLGTSLPIASGIYYNRHKGVFGLSYFNDESILTVNAGVSPIVTTDSSGFANTDVMVNLRPSKPKAGDCMIYLNPKFINDKSKLKEVSLRVKRKGSILLMVTDDIGVKLSREIDGDFKHIVMHKVQEHLDYYKVEAWIV